MLTTISGDASIAGLVEDLESGAENLAKSGIDSARRRAERAAAARIDEVLGTEPKTKGAPKAKAKAKAKKVALPAAGSSGTIATPSTLRSGTPWRVVGAGVAGVALVGTGLWYALR